MCFGQAFLTTFNVSGSVAASLHRGVSKWIYPVWCAMFVGNFAQHSNVASRIVLLSFASGSVLTACPSTIRMSVWVPACTSLSGTKWESMVSYARIALFSRFKVCAKHLLLLGRSLSRLWCPAPGKIVGHVDSEMNAWS